MGHLENQNRKNTRKSKIQKVLLETIKAVGVLSLALVAPNAVKLLGGVIKKKDEYNAKQALNRLIKNGFVKLEVKSGFKVVRLTERGDDFLRKFERSGYKLKKPKKWDGKWRIVIFDIKEYRREIRDQLRQTLIHVGFTRLQQSVWVYPYDCEDLIVMLKADFEIGKDVLYIIADSIENDRFLRKKFDLDVV